MGKRLIDLFIVLIVLAALAVGGYFAYDMFLAEEDTEEDTSTTSGATAQVTDATLQLPPLDQTQLTAVLPTIDDLPAAYSGAEVGTPYTPDFAAYEQELATKIGPDFSVRFSEIRADHNWHPDLGIEFDTCTLGQQIGSIKVEVSQFGTPDAARAFIDDPLVRGFYQALGFTLTEADTVHGWFLTSSTPVKGSCFAENEWATHLFFEHWGMLFTVQGNVSAAADADIGHSVSVALAPRLIQHVEQLDVLTGITIPPTPVPSGPTFDRLLSADVDPENLTLLVPTSQGWDFFNIYSTDPDETLSLTLLELVDFYRGPNTAALNQLAAEIDRAGRRYGLIAREVRAFKPDADCPTDEPVRIDVTLSLFERPAGAVAYMQDVGLQTAWRGTGLFSEHMASGATVYAYGSVNHECGAMQIIQKSAHYERLLYTISITIPTAVPREEAQAAVDAMLGTALRNTYLRGL